MWGPSLIKCNSRPDHSAQSSQTVRLPVWPWQQVCVRPVWNGGGASIMNIHYDVTGLLTVVWRSHSGQIVWPAGVGQGRGGGGGGGGSELTAHIRDIKESAGSRQLDRWRWTRWAFTLWPSLLNWSVCMPVLLVNRAALRHNVNNSPASVSVCWELFCYVEQKDFFIKKCCLSAFDEYSM